MLKMFCDKCGIELIKKRTGEKKQILDKALETIKEILNKNE